MDSEYSGERLVLGSSDSADVPLPGLAGDLLVSADGTGGCRISGRGVRLRRDQQETGRVRLAIGEQVGVPGYRIEVIAAPTGFDLALQVAAEEDASAAVRRAAQLRLSGVWPVGLASVIALGALRWLGGLETLLTWLRGS